MKTLKYILFISFFSIILFSCGRSGKNRKREPSRESKKIEAIEKKSDINETERYNGNYRKSLQPKRSLNKSNKIRSQEENNIREHIPNQTKIEKRVQLELKIWEASKSGNTALFEKLKEESYKLMKNMSQQELDEAYKKIKDIKKRQ